MAASSSSSSASAPAPSSFFFGSSRPPICREFELYQDCRALSITNTRPVIKRVWTGSILNYVPVESWTSFAHYFSLDSEGFEAIEKEFQKLMTQKLEEKDREKDRAPKGIPVPLSVVAERVGMELLMQPGSRVPALSAWPESDGGREPRVRRDRGRRVSWSPFTIVIDLQDSVEDRCSMTC